MKCDHVQTRIKRKKKKKRKDEKKKKERKKEKRKKNVKRACRVAYSLFFFAFNRKALKSNL